MLAGDAVLHPGPHRGYEGMPSEERAACFARNSYTWPPETGTAGWPPRPQPESEAFRETRDQLEAWIRRDVVGDDLKFHEFTNLVQSRLMPAFTPHGFKVADFTKILPDVWRAMRAMYESKVVNAATFASLRFEDIADASAGALRPRFYDQDELNQRAMEGLRPTLEQWSGVKLRDGQAYGVRVYRNGSSLVNHIDRSETHVISAIVHIGHALDEPWPIQVRRSFVGALLIALSPVQIIAGSPPKHH